MKDAHEIALLRARNMIVEALRAGGRARWSAPAESCGGASVKDSGQLRCAWPGFTLVPEREPRAAPRSSHEPRLSSAALTPLALRKLASVVATSAMSVRYESAALSTLRPD